MVYKILIVCFLIWSGIIFQGCSKIYVANINDVKEIKCSPEVYYLPKNVVRVTLNMIRTSHQCGPYNRFAKKLLGINNQFTEHTTLWKISGVDIETYAVTDTSNIYLIFNNYGKNAASLNLTGDGFLQSINSKLDNEIVKQQSLILNLTREEKQHYLFTDLSTKKIQVNKSDTIYKKVRSDTGFVKVPEVNTKIINKNLEEKAEEIATQIFNIREEKVNILTGDYNASINAQAVKSIVEELEKIEDKYVSLFTTIIRQDTVSYVFDFTPDHKMNQKILCWFSEISGVSFKPDSLFRPVTIDVSKNTVSKSVAGMIAEKTKKKAKKYGLFYRIPELADANIIYKSEIIASKKLLISQLGSVMALPKKILNDRKNSIEFFPEYGSLKSLQRKEYHHGRHK